MSKADNRCFNDVILNLCSGLIRLTARFDERQCRVLGTWDLGSGKFPNRIGKEIDSTFLNDRKGEDYFVSFIGIISVLYL